MNDTKKSNYISVADLAKRLNISRVAVFKRIQKGQIPAEKIGHSYVINRELADELTSGRRPEILSQADKIIIEKAVAKTVKDYGETLKLLGKE